MRRRALILAGLMVAAACSPSGTTSTSTGTTSAATTASTSTAVTTTAVPGPEPVPVAAKTPTMAGEVIYFVMIDRFANGDPDNDTGGSEAEDPLVHGFLPTDKGWFHGGDLAGIVERLDYIAGLGATAIWITPPFRNRPVQGRGEIENSSAGYHGYWIVDFEHVDPHFGTDSDLDTLVEAAHERGLKVIADIVVNHTADVITYAETGNSYRSLLFDPYLDAAGNEFDPADFAGTGTFPELDPAISFPYTPIFATEADADAKSPAWLNDPIHYHNRGNTNFTGENIRYGDFFGLDDLFTEHPRVVEGMIEIYRNAIERFEFDGFRVDTAKHVNDEFWVEFLPEVTEAAPPGFFVFGEVSGSDPVLNSRYTTDLGFPAVLDFGFSEAGGAFVAGRAGPKVLADHFDDDDWFTGAGKDARSLVTFIGNHDQGRVGWFVLSGTPGAGEEERLRRVGLALELLMTTRGVPTIYYGDEQGFVGDGGDKDARQDMFPSRVESYNDDDLLGSDATTADDNFDPSHPLYSLLVELTRLRADHPALAHGHQITRYSQVNAGVFAFSRVDPDGLVEYLVATNNAESEQRVGVTLGTPSARFDPIYPAGAAGLRTDPTGASEVVVPPLSTVVLRADRPLAPPTSPPTPRIVQPVDGATVELDRFRIEVEFDGLEYAEASFALSVDGGPRLPLGTDAAPPYRVFWDSRPHPAGAVVELFVTVRDAFGGEATTTSRFTLGGRD